MSACQTPLNVRASGDGRQRACRAARGMLGFSLALAAMSCTFDEPVRTVIERRCLPADGSQEIRLTLTSPTKGLLHVGVEQRGISVAARLGDGLAEQEEGWASAAVRRVGRISLARTVEPQANVPLQIVPRDSREVRGEVCVTAELVPDGHRARVKAELAEAAAGRAVHEREWQRAFLSYGAAARRFDALGLRARAGAARHAMAELAYWRLQRAADGYALAVRASVDLPADVDALAHGALLHLRAMALLEIPGRGSPGTRHGEVARLLDAARRRLQVTRYGVRELPRIEIFAGFLDYRANRLAEARRRFAAAARHCSELRDWECHALARQNEASLLEEESYPAALAAYHDALRELDPEVFPDTASVVWDNLGRLQASVGLFEQSERSHLNAVRLYAEIGSCDGLRRALSRLGALALETGSFGDADAYLRHVATLDCRDLLAQTVGWGSRNPSGMPDFGTRSMIADESIPVAALDSCVPGEAPHSLSTDAKLPVFNALSSLGRLALLTGNPAQAHRCIDSAAGYAATPRTRLRLAIAQGDIALAHGDAPDAQRAFAEALRIADQANLPQTHENRTLAHLGLARAALAGGKAAEALQHAREALWMSGARADVGQIVTSLELIAEGLERQGAPGEALATLRAAADLIERVPIEELDGEKRATYLASQHAVFARLTEITADRALARSDETAADVAWAAFETAERGRARALRYAATQTMADREAPQRADEFADLLAGVRRIVDESAPGTDWNVFLERLQRLVGEPARTATLDREALLRQLERLDAALVEYVVGRDEMFAFVIERGTIRLVRLAEHDRIAAAADALRELLRNPEAPARDIRMRAADLARLVLWPLSGGVGSSRLVFVPDDVLHTVPFALLPWNESEPEVLVLHRAASTIVPSAEILARPVATGRMQRGALNVALFGDPVFRMTDWERECDEPVSGIAAGTSRVSSSWSRRLPRLPGTRKEVLAIAELIRQTRPASRVTTRLGCAATRSELRSAAESGPALLHIATHGHVDAWRPRLSALALTPDGDEDESSGAFGLLDILGLRLQARLVVLSACETSRGRLLPGEGVLGPTQAFLQAGASSVLASLWRVDDEATARFMRDFYEYLLVERLDAASALRRAQLRHAEDGPVRDWAAFSLYGWPDATL